MSEKVTHDPSSCSQCTKAYCRHCRQLIIQTSYGWRHKVSGGELCVVFRTAEPDEATRGAS